LSQENERNGALEAGPATTYAHRFEFAPNQIAHLTGSIDYFHIQVKDEMA